MRVVPNLFPAFEGSEPLRVQNLGGFDHRNLFARAVVWRLSRKVVAAPPALDRVAVLAALNFAHELQQLRNEDESSSREIARSLGDLQRKLDGLFDAPAG